MTDLAQKFRAFLENFTDFERQDVGVCGLWDTLVYSKQTNTMSINVPKIANTIKMARPLKTNTWQIQWQKFFRYFEKSFERNIGSDEGSNSYMGTVSNFRGG